MILFFINKFLGGIIIGTIVRHSNEINSLKTGTLTEAELDLFITALFLLKDKKTDEITLPFSNFRNLAEIKDRHSDRLINQIKSMSKKLINMNQEITLPDGVIKIFNFFRTITIDPNNNIVKLAVNEDFQYLINDLVGNYTEYDLKHLVSLSSKYSKQLFKLLKQFDNNLVNSKKFFLIEQEKFLEKLNISNIKRSDLSKLLKSSTLELEPYFFNLKLERLNSEQEFVINGQKTKYLKWTWENEAGMMRIVNKTYSKYTKEMKEERQELKQKKNNETKKVERIVEDVEIIRENKATEDILEKNKISLSMDIMSNENLKMNEKLPWLSELSQINDVTEFLIFITKFKEFKKIKKY